MFKPTYRVPRYALNDCFHVDRDDGFGGRIVRIKAFNYSSPYMKDNDLYQDVTYIYDEIDPRTYKSFYRDGMMELDKLDQDPMIVRFYQENTKCNPYE